MISPAANARWRLCSSVKPLARPAMISAKSALCITMSLALPRQFCNCVNDDLIFLCCFADFLPWYRPAKSSIAYRAFDLNPQPVQLLRAELVDSCASSLDPFATARKLFGGINLDWHFAPRADRRVFRSAP